MTNLLAIKVSLLLPRDPCYRCRAYKYCMGNKLDSKFDIYERLLCAKSGRWKIILFSHSNLDDLSKESLTLRIHELLKD